MKIILIIIGIIGWFFTMTICYIAGLLRGFKLMSQQNVEQSQWERNLLNTFYSKNKSVDPFLKNKFIREEIEKEKKKRAELPSEIDEYVEQQKQIAKQKVESKAKKKKKVNKKAKKNVKK